MMTFTSTPAQYIDCDDALCGSCFDERGGVHGWHGFEDWESPAYLSETEALDTPQHCARCSALIPTNLTDEGIKYVREAILKDAYVGARSVLRAWADNWDYILELDDETLERVATWPCLEDDATTDVAQYDADQPRASLDVDALTEDHRAFIATMADAYEETAIWSSVGDDGEPIERAEGVLTDAARATMLEQCEQFYAEAAMHLKASDDASVIGTNFWLTRNGHGAGFWDLGWGARGTALSDMARAHGEANLYVTDEGDIELS